MSMVDRVAFEIGEALEKQGGLVQTFDGATRIEGDFDLKAVARAAIEEFRLPQLEMIAAFWRQKNNGTQEIGETGDAKSDYDAFAAYADAALKTA